MTRSTAEQHRGVAKRIKYAMPKKVFEIIRPLANSAVSVLPDTVKYRVGNLLRRGKYPYRVIKNGDTVIQIGAPRDLLKAGRSRAIHFSQFVGTGRVVIIEPDPENCRALRHFIDRHGLQERVELIEKGVWSQPGELDFLSSPDHPAANVLVEAKEIDDTLMAERHYDVIKVPVDSLDRILVEAGVDTVSLVSITTNGAEPQILDGMKGVMSRGLEYISLASTNQGYPELMLRRGYSLIAFDDRGYTFRRVGG